MLPYSDIELTVRKSKTLEGRLKREHNAKGRGLGELTKSVEGKLPDETIQQLYKVDKMRNVIVHEEGHNRLPSRRKFLRLCDDAESSLDKLKPPKQAQDWRSGCLVVTFILMAASIVYLLSQNAL